MKFYYAPQTRAVTVHWMLEELGIEYELKVLNLKKGENMDPAYLAVNPMGKVPALERNGECMNEAAAICTYLADEFPEQRLNIPAGAPGRGPYLRWLFYAPSCIEPAIIDAMLKREEGPASSLGYGNMGRVLAMLSGQLKKTPYIAGDRFTAADVVVGGTLLWGQMAGVLPKDRPEYQEYGQRLKERAAYQTTWNKSNELAKELSS